MKHLILLIEGKRVDRPSYMAGLNKKGFIVESVVNGAAAINKLDELKPNAVIIDAAIYAYDWNTYLHVTAQCTQ